MSFYKLFNSCQIEAFGLTEILTCPELEAGLFPTADFFSKEKTMFLILIQIQNYSNNILILDL